MNKNKLNQACRAVLRGGAATSLPILVVFGMSGVVSAASINTGNPDLSVRWDNTLKYSNAFRVKDQADELVEPSPNADDGDRNFDKGLISNRFDVLSEVDVVYKNYGFRVSGAAWYDTVYNESNDHDSPSTVNKFGPHDEFSDETQELHGREAELLDLFATAYWDIGDSALNIRAGRHAHIWGESLFLGANGVAGAMAPVDVVKLLSVPSTQFREAIRPVNQISGQYQVNENLSFAAYYQFEWEENRLPGSGSYFSGGDVLGKGADFINAGPFRYLREDDLDADDSGQGGVSVRFNLPNSGIDYGLYAIRFHSKSPQTVTRPVAGPPANGLLGNYHLVYQEDIDLFGASASMVIADASVGIEVSTRRNTNLVSLTDEAAPGASDEDVRKNPPYPVGNTAHAQVSWLYSAGPNWLSQEGFFVGEVAWNRVLSVDENPENLDSRTTRDAVGLRVGYTPSYRQIASGLDLSFPVTVGYNPVGRSGAIANFNGGAGDSGVYSIGVDGTYLGTWNFSLSYTGYMGSAGTGGGIVNGENEFTFKQNLKDRDYVAFSVDRTF